MQIVVNDFVMRQHGDSRFSYFQGTWSQLVKLVEENWEKAKPGYRTGVILVPVPAAGPWGSFYSSIVQLEEGDALTGQFVRRREGEAPRKTLTTTSRVKLPATSVDIVVYSSKTLAEGGDNHLPPKEGNWEIISINASPLKGEAPIHPMVLMHNHFGSSGGTATGLNDTDFVDILRHSFHFWRDNATCG